MSNPTGTVFRHCPNQDGSFTEADIPDPLETELVTFLPDRNTEHLHRPAQAVIQCT